MRQELHPEIEPFISAIPFEALDEEMLPAIRAAKVEMPLSDDVVRTEHTVPARVHRAKDAEGLQPCVYSIHGGGFVLGSYDMDDVMFDRWCPTYGIVGVSVEYRLAPETPYPGPLDDCYAGLQWTYENAEEL